MLCVLGDRVTSALGRTVDWLQRRWIRADAATHGPLLSVVRPFAVSWSNFALASPVSKPLSNELTQDAREVFYETMLNGTGVGA